MRNDAPKILTIDDDHTVRENIAAYLEDSGFDVVRAENGKLGLEVYEKERPDLILVDLRMPVMDGTEVVKRMQRNAPEVPVIVVSGVGVLEEAVDALRIGAWDFVTKPIADMEVLEHAVNKALERARLLEERKRYQERLEQEVAERTRELRESNERLIDIQGLLQEQNQFLGTLIESIPNPVFYKDLDGTYLGCNRLFSELHNISQEEVTGRQDTDLLPEEANCLEPGPNSSTLPCELTLEVDGQERHLVLYKSFFYNRDGEPSGVVGTFHEITELKNKEAQITYQAHHDELTGLPNRLKLKKHIAQLVHEDPNRQITLLFLDLDNFKTVNDSLGHKIGDRLLTDVALRLAALSGPESVVARLGGDEYVVLTTTPQTAQECMDMAQNVLESFETPFVIAEHELYLTSSIGITTYPQDGTDPDTLIKNADIAMYRAKAQERNSYMRFSNEMVEQVTKRLAVEKNIRKGLENNEFIPFFQPRVDLATGNVTGMEALVRWLRPDGSIVNPMEFIPVAEETGLIVSLGETIMRKACEQAHRWHRNGMENLKVSVNISAHQFRANLLDVVNAVVADTGIDPHMLELEITESTMLQNIGLTIPLLETLAAQGISTAIDDFGTGYSSLSYLKNLPINTLKIDRSFVSDILRDESDASIVRAVITMARDLSLQVVAEGVEEEGQLEFLQQHGCPEVQGYYYSKPLPAAEFEAFMAKQSS